MCCIIIVISIDVTLVLYFSVCVFLVFLLESAVVKLYLITALTSTVITMMITTF